MSKFPNTEKYISNSYHSYNRAKERAAVQESVLAQMKKKHFSR